MTLPTRPVTPLRTLHLIRLSIFGGALLFGIVTWWMRRETPPPMEADLGPLRFVGYVLWVGVLVALAFLRGLFGKATDSARRTSLLIVSWAAAEALALFGGVVWFLHGDSRWYVAGMCFLLATFILFPLARE
ncbi:MAG TPA: hypothetical protein VJ650_12705 [Gemmatimonadaceae bacterium]|nr:hypothetical protein [Gemmatimonadaceae bacterium]